MEQSVGPRSDQITIKDLELLMKSSTETQAILTEILHAFELSETKTIDILLGLKEHGCPIALQKLDTIIQNISSLEKKIFKWAVLLVSSSTVLALILNLLINLLTKN